MSLCNNSASRFNTVSIFIVYFRNSFFASNNCLSSNTHTHTHSLPHTHSPTHTHSRIYAQTSTISNYISRQHKENDVLVALSHNQTLLLLVGGHFSVTHKPQMLGDCPRCRPSETPVCVSSLSTPAVETDRDIGGLYISVLFNPHIVFYKKVSLSKF